MWKNYWTTSVRAFTRNPLYTAINAGGLAVGFACCILLGLFVENELTYDAYHDDVDRIYRIVETTQDPSGEARKSEILPYPLAQTLRNEAPGLASVVQMSVASGKTVRPTDQPTTAFDDVDVYVADSTFTDVFSVATQVGDLPATLRSPDRAALSETMARRLFGRTDVVGEQISIEFQDDAEAQSYSVGAVVDDPPSNSSFQYDVLVSISELKNTTDARVWGFLSNSWRSGFVITFVKQAPGADRASLESKLASVVENRFPEEEAGQTALSLQPLTQMRQATEVTTSFETRSPSALYVMGALALLVLLVACVNFVTLTLGQSARRTHEIGVRKALGAGARHVRQQFWGEALLISGAAGVAGVLLARIFAPTFNTLAQTSVSFDLFGNPGRVLLVILLTVAVGLLAGGYPAVLLARLKPSRILRGHSTVAPGQMMTRVLMVVQFALSIGFLAGALIIARQIDYMQTKDPGFVTEKVITFSASNLAAQQSTDQLTLGEGSMYERFRKEATRLRSVKAVTGSVMPVGTLQGDGLRMMLTAPDGSVPATVNAVDSTFVETLDIGVVAGRTFQDARSGEGVIVNQALVDAMGWDNPVGREISGEGQFAAVVNGSRVIGVVENFHLKSMRHAVEPVLLMQEGAISGASLNVMVRLANGPVDEALQDVKEVWAKVAPSVPFNYQFLDDRMAAQYEAEQRWQRITAWASVFALLIACAGLFGLATLATQRRTREIGIRKALGASVPRILALVSSEFLKLVGVAFLIATPLAYGALREWLQTFPYRIDLTGGWLVVAGAITALVAAFAVGVQAYRAAQSNPVDALRSES